MTDHDGVPGTAVAAASWAPGWPVALEDDLDLALPIATDLIAVEASHEVKARTGNTPARPGNARDKTVEKCHGRGGGRLIGPRRTDSPPADVGAVRSAPADDAAGRRLPTPAQFTGPPGPCSYFPTT